MTIVKVILPCPICHRIGVTHKLNVEDVDATTGLPLSGHVRKLCFSCKNFRVRDGPKRHGFNILSRIESKEDEIRQAIFETQVIVFSRKEVKEFERRLREQGMICLLGRSEKNLEHPVCSSCQGQGIDCPSGKKTKREHRVHHFLRTRTDEGRKTLVLSTCLDSPNVWTNKNNARRIYVRIRQRWEKLLEHHALPFWGGHLKRKRRLSIVFYVPTGYQKIRDEDNLVGATKPVVDVMKRLGVFFDDTPNWLERMPIQQIVDKSLDESIVTLTVCEIEEVP